jgi:hypothetical protein
MYPPDDPDYHPIASVRTMFVDEIGGGAPGTIIEHLQASTAMMSVTQIRVLGGAMARVPDENTAFSHRDRALMVNVAAVYESVDEREAHEDWVTGLGRDAATGRSRRVRQLPGRRGRGAHP